MIEVGSPAPDFNLKNQNNENVSLSDFNGKNIVLYFYPKDNTPGCTKEACAFRDEFAEFQGLDAVIIGISADSENSHKKFIDKFSLPFNLLSDTDKKVIELYGVWKEKVNFGIKSLGIERSTFVIDKDGIIRKVFRKVKVDGHNEEIKKILKELQG